MDGVGDRPPARVSFIAPVMAFVCISTVALDSERMSDQIPESEGVLL
jgi:hypothetical protein